MKDEICTLKIADFIRARSKARNLTALADLESEFYLPDPDHPIEPVETLIQDVTLRHDDIKAVLDADCHPFYYSEKSMTGAYARVLVLKGEGSFRMIAEVIREHSRVYPRPVPVLLFQYPPFDLSKDQIAAALEEMMQKKTYRDIARLITSIGNLFVYSTDYLDCNHAAMLAEWMDVGQAENP